MRTSTPCIHLSLLLFLKLSPSLFTSPPLLKTVVNRPLAGTRARGRTVEEDQLLEQQLLADEKEVAEHVMLVDLGRNDVGKVRLASFYRRCLL